MPWFCFCRGVPHARSKTGRSATYIAETGADLSAISNSSSFPEYAITPTQRVAAGNANSKTYALPRTESARSVPSSL